MANDLNNYYYGASTCVFNRKFVSPLVQSTDCIQPNTSLLPTTYIVKLYIYVSLAHHQVRLNMHQEYIICTDWTCTYYIRPRGLEGSKYNHLCLILRTRSAAEQTIFEQSLESCVQSLADLKTGLSAASNISTATET